MKFREIKLLLIDDAARFLCLEDSKYLSLVNEILPSNFNLKSKLLENVNEIYKKMELKSLKIDAYKLANIYLSHEDRIQIYYEICEYSFFSYNNDLSGLLLKRIEERLNLDRMDSLHIREKMFYRNYQKDLNLTSITRGMLSYFWISFSNDGVVDKPEWDYFKSLMRKMHIEQKTPAMKFDLANLVKFTSINLKNLKELKEKMLGAATSDGLIERNEKSLIEKILKSVDVTESDHDMTDNTQLLMVLGILMCDGKLEESEKEWFLKVFSSGKIVLTINEAFVYLDMITKNHTLYLKHKTFFDSVWGMGADNFSLVCKLYIPYAKYYLKLDSKSFGELLRYAKEAETSQMLNFIKKVNNLEVTKEELFLIYGILTSPFYSLKKFNSCLDYGYFERVLTSLGSSVSDVEYYFICSAILLDRKVSGSEYEYIWSRCKKLNLDFKRLEQAVRNYSLVRQKQFKIDTYHRYLVDLEVA